MRGHEDGEQQLQHHGQPLEEGHCEGHRGAARKKAIKIGLYYSHVDWHDPAFAWDLFHYQYDPSFTKESDPVRWQTLTMSGNRFLN